jgi:predicted TPR repeat methyltransferase
MGDPSDTPTLVSPDEAVRVALAWHREGRFAEAAILYQRTLEVEPTHAEALHFLGMLKHQLGAPDDGLDYVRQAVTIAPHYAEAQCNLGNMLYERNELDDAEAAYLAALDLQPALTDALNNLGLLSKRRGDPEAAEGWLRRAIDQAPENPTAYSNLAHLLADRERYEEAETLLERAIELEPQFAAAHRNLADVYHAQGRLPEATAAYQRAVELGADGLLGLATTLRKQGLVEEAIAAFRRAWQLGARDPSLFHSLGSLLSAQGKQAEAADVFQQWLTWDPDNPVAAHMLSANTANTSHQLPSRAPDDYVEAIFDGFARHFDRRLQSLEYRAPELVARALVEDHADVTALHILDAGCGTGLCGPLLRDSAAVLEGVDLSRAMLERAEQRGCYDRLVKAELTAFLEQHSARYDAVVSADTLVYFGDLKHALRASARALRAQGRLVFTVEQLVAANGAVYRLQGNGRYAHSAAYIQRVIEHTGLRLLRSDEVVLRLEMANPVAGLLVVAERSTTPYPLHR